MAGRDLHAFLEVATPMNVWMPRSIEDFGFSDGSDFTTFLMESTGGRPTKEYMISISMAKELAWMPEQIEAFGFVDGSDFEVIAESGKNPLGGRPTKEYMISISMAKELAWMARAPPANRCPTAWSVYPSTSPRRRLTSLDGWQALHRAGPFS